jgi:hypothetical protein
MITIPPPKLFTFFFPLYQQFQSPVLSIILTPISFLPSIWKPLYIFPSFLETVEAESQWKSVDIGRLGVCIQEPLIINYTSRPGTDQGARPSYYDRQLY